MEVKHNFGGQWTTDKLDILSGYLNAYAEALKEKPFKKIYIDAFAGTGYIDIEGYEDIIEGSARLSLKVDNYFDEYHFIEKKRKFAKKLEETKIEYPHISEQINIINDDCNAALKRLCREIDWRRNRAVLFLDPYATEVEWSTLEAIADTKAIDMWYLFPLSAVNRMLRRDGKMEESWKSRLDSLFGERGWLEEFYITNPQVSLFDSKSKDLCKSADTDAIKKYIIKRLDTIFAQVSYESRVLYNTKNSPLFLFCFAVSNDYKGAKDLAFRIANHLLKPK